MVDRDPWRLIRDVGASDSRGAGTVVVATLVADGHEALLPFWAWLCTRVEECAQALGVCVTDGLHSEAVEVVLGGRSAFEPAVTTLDALGAVTGEEGFRFVDELLKASEDRTGEEQPRHAAVSEGYDATVNRVRALLDHIVDPDPDAGGWVQTSDWDVPLRGTVDLVVPDSALRGSARPPGRQAVTVAWVMARDVVRWDSFLEACELKGRAAGDVLSELGAAVLETWPACVAVGKASER